MPFCAAFLYCLFQTISILVGSNVGAAPAVGQGPASRCCGLSASSLTAVLGQAQRHPAPLVSALPGRR